MVTVPTNNNEQTLTYKSIDGNDILLDFLPPITEKYEKAPLYYIICGGGWAQESRQSMLDYSRISVQKLRENGFAVVSIDYRVLTYDMTNVNDISVEDQLRDCCDALEYLAENADVLKLDPQKVFISGHSAGGQLASTVAFADNSLFLGKQPSYKIIGAIPLSPICYFYPMPSGEKNSCFFDYTYIFPAKKYDEAKAHIYSCVDHICETTAPALFIHGLADTVVRVENSIAAYNRGKELGLDFELITPTNGGHILESVPEGANVYPKGETCQEIMAAWVINHLK